MSDRPDIDDKFQPVTRDDVTDLAGLPMRFDRFAAEVRTNFELIGHQIMSMLKKHDELLIDAHQRISSNEMEIQKLRHEIDTLKKRRRKNERKSP